MKKEIGAIFGSWSTAAPKEKNGKWLRAAVIVPLVTAAVGLLLSATAAAMVSRETPRHIVARHSGTKYLFPSAVVNLAARRSYPRYDNDVFPDCVAATVGDLIITSFDSTPSISDVAGAFFFAGGTSTSGLSWPQLVNYWASTHFAGTVLDSWSPLRGGNQKLRVERWLDHGGTVGGYPGQRAVIDEVRLPRDAVVVDGANVGPGNHMWLVVGYTRRDALVVSWGTEFEVSWGQLLDWSAPRGGWGGFDVVAAAEGAAGAPGPDAHLSSRSS